MARPLRIEFPGAIYHVTSRMLGSWRQARDRLFRDERDHERFLERLGEGVADFGIRLYLFTLMSNHYHLVLETPEGNLSRFMQSLSTAYTVSFNKRHRRHGPLLDGRYKAKLVSGEDYLLRLSRYVHQNPVWTSGWNGRAIRERIEHLRAYGWSSYPGYIGRGKQWGFVDESPVLAMMAGGMASKRKSYREYVETGLATGDEEFQEALKASPSGIGEESFLKWVEGLRGRKLKRSARPEDLAFRRVREPLSASVVLQTVAEVLGVPEEAFARRRRNSPLRAVASRVLIRYAGHTQREVAGLLGTSTGGAISAQMARLPALLKGDPRLARKVRRIERRLEERREEAAGEWKAPVPGNTGR